MKEGLSFCALSYVATSLARPSMSGMLNKLQLGEPSTLGQPPGVLQCGGCNTSIHPMGPNFPQCASTEQWIPPGQALWQSPSLTVPPGMSSGCHLPVAPAPATPHGPPTMSFTPVALHTAIPSVQPVASALPDGNQSIGISLHQGQEQTSAHPTPTPMSTTEVDINKLEERLGEVMNKKLESITETLKASLSNNIENSSMASPKAPKWCKLVLGYLCPMFKMVLQRLLQYQFPLKFIHLQNFLCYQVKQSRIHVLKSLCHLTQHPDLP